MVIPLAEANRYTNGNGRSFNQFRAEGTAAEAKTVFVQIGLKVVLRQAMISVQDECFGVADSDVQPVERLGIRVIRFALMGIALQGGNISAVSIAMDLTSLRKC